MRFVSYQFEYNVDVYMKYTYIRFINILKCKMFSAFLIFHKTEQKY